MKSFILLLWLGLCSCVHAQPNFTYWYDLDHQRIEALRQPDVWAFRLIDKEILEILPSPVVDTVFFYPREGIHVLAFSSAATSGQREEQKNKIRSLGNFERDFQVLCSDSAQSYHQGNWHVSDDRVILAFQDPEITLPEVEDFALRWGLKIDQAPVEGLPPGGNYTWSFKVIELSRYAADLAHEIMEAEPEVVKITDPNLLNVVQLAGGNDPWYPEQWYIENTGQLLWNGASGQNDADCDIDRVWDLGYAGEGITVSVLDGFGFDLKHEDLIAKIDSPWTAIDDTILAPDTAQTTWFHYAHGSHMLGMIGASGDNHKGIKGVAYKARLNPIEIWPANTLIVARGFQYSLLFGGDVVNCSFLLNGSMGFGTVQQEIKNLKTLGRNGLGSVVVSAAGNSGDSSMYFPCGWPETICMVGTSPDDSLLVRNGKWTTSIGSNYGEWCDLAAPGADIATTDHSGGEGWLPGDYFPTFDGTSASSAITSGVCALILEKNPNLRSDLSQDQVKDLLISGAEKVYPGFYNYQYYPGLPGKSRFLGYGRLNVYNSIQLAPVGISDDLTDLQQVLIKNPVEDELFIYRGKNSGNKDLQISCLSLSGQVHFSKLMKGYQNKLALDVSFLNQGLHLIKVESKEGDYSKTFKIVKL